MLLATALTPTLASGLMEAPVRRNHRADPRSEDSCNTRLSDPLARGQTSPAPPRPLLLLFPLQVKGQEPGCSTQLWLWSRKPALTNSDVKSSTVSGAENEPCCRAFSSRRRQPLCGLLGNRAFCPIVSPYC